MNRVLLTTEGTYPYGTGGVTTWCDQFVRALPDFEVTVLALTGPHPGEIAVPLAGNVEKLIPLPLWRRPADRAPAWPWSRAPRAFDRALARLLAGLDGDAAAFEGGLQDLADLGEAVDLWPLFERRGAWESVAAALRELKGPEPRAAEVALAVNWLRGSLAPLLRAPPPADVAVTTLVGLGALPAWLAKVRRGAPLVLVEHGVYLRERLLGFSAEGDPPPVKRLRAAFFDTLTRLLYARADAVLAVSAFNREWQLHLGAHEERTRVIPNGVAPADFPPASSTPPGRPPTVSWVGRVDPLKDLETLVRAFRVVVDALPQARLRLYGPVPSGNEAYREKVASVVRDLGLGEAVSFEGPVRPVYTAYHAGDVVALSSISEGFPYTVIEAMMTGRPVVATRVGGVAEAVGDTGWLVPSRDPKALAGGLLTLLRDAPLREALGEAARARALTHFTLERMGGAYAALLRELVAVRIPEVEHESERSVQGATPRAVPSLVWS